MAKQQSKPIDSIGDEAPAPAALPPLAERGKQTDKLAPTCPYCGALCKAGSSPPLFTRYYCPNCKNYSEKRARPELRRRGRAAIQEDEDFSAR